MHCQSYLDLHAFIILLVSILQILNIIMNEKWWHFELATSAIPQPSPLGAVDACYKAHYILDMKYHDNTY